MKRTYRSLVLALIVLLSATNPAVGAAPDAEFGSDRVEVTAGEAADITVALAETDAAVVTIGSKRVNYIATIVVQDGNGDGTVTLRYDTSNAGHGGAFAVADGADDVTVESESEFDADHLLAAGAYDLSVAPGSNASASDETDAATLTVTEPPKTLTETDTSTPGPYAGHVDDIEDGVVVAPAQNQTVTGTLDLDRGTEITVAARKDGAFLKTRTATVDEDGRFSVSFDFDDVSSEDPEFEIRIRADGERLEDVTGKFETPPPTQTATTTNQAMQDETNQKTAEPSQDGSVPGFGLVTGVVALAAAGLLVRRRG